MASFRRDIDFVRLVAVVMAGAFLSACMTWQTQSPRPERFRAADSTQTVRLTLTSGETIMVHAPVITGDTLVGMQTRPGTSPDSLERVIIPLATISQAEIKKNDPVGNVLIGIGVFAAFVGIYAAGHPCIGLCSAH